MTKYLIAIINGASGIFLIHSFCLFIYKQFNPIEDDDKYILLNSRIKKLENELKDLALIVDTLEEKVEYLEDKIVTKEQDLLQSTLDFNNKLEYLVNNNYDLIETTTV